MKKLYLLLALVTTFVSCTNKNSYRYIEIRKEKSPVSYLNDETEEEPVLIEAESDSIAYLEAFQKFVISKKVYKDMGGSKSLIDEPVNYKLLNEQGKDLVLYVNFSKIDSIKISIETKIASLPNHIKEPVGLSEETPKIDSVKIKQLKPFFNFKKDEFDASGLTWYTPKSAPEYANINSLYCYFQVVNGIASNLRFKLQYAAEDWLFIERVQFSIDGNAYELVPTDVKSDNGSGGIWEWFDESVSYGNKDIIDALSNAKSAKMKIIGHQYHKVKPVTASQILNIKRSLELYKAMGGEF